MRDLMLLIAEAKNTESGIQSVLSHIREDTHAIAAFWRWVDRTGAYAVGLEAEQVPTVDELAIEGASIILRPSAPGIAPDELTNWALIPLVKKEELIAVVGIIFPQSQTLDDDVLDALELYVGAGRLLASYADKFAQYERLIQNQSQFVRVVSHDVRAPLTSMLGFASMLESGAAGPLNERQAYFLAKVLSGITQIEALVENIQDAGRFDPDNGFYELHREPTDIGQMIKLMVQNYLLPPDKQSLELNVDLADDLPILNIDANMVERAITNLVDNAVKYTPDGSQVIAGAKVDGKDFVIWVQDNGNGIGPEHLDKLFDRHYRARLKEHARIKGSGLGLFIVRSVAIQHGGRAKAESAEGQGSTFSIHLPLSGANLVGYDEAAQSMLDDA